MERAKASEDPTLVNVDIIERFWRKIGSFYKTRDGRNYLSIRVGKEYYLVESKTFLGREYLFVYDGVGLHKIIPYDLELIK